MPARALTPELQSTNGGLGSAKRITRRQRYAQLRSAMPHHVGSAYDDGELLHQELPRQLALPCEHAARLALRCGTLAIHAALERAAVRDHHCRPARSVVASSRQHPLLPCTRSVVLRTCVHHLALRPQLL
jgi:hypothetical protein